MSCLALEQAVPAATLDDTRTKPMPSNSATSSTEMVLILARETKVRLIQIR